MLYIREKTVPSVLLNPNNMKNIKERQCLSFYFALNLYNFFKNIDFNKNAVIIVLGFCLKPYFFVKAIIINVFHIFFHWNKYEIFSSFLF